MIDDLVFGGMRKLMEEIGLREIKILNSDFRGDSWKGGGFRYFFNGVWFCYLRSYLVYIFVFLVKFFKSKIFIFVLDVV